ncbi:unnamed protein product [Spirodela intermedia]|uniref:Uncharacterized protein n=1 Tax=Spirodela intermedia TaxID=51605 RepID=A0A7I8IQ62_SPIIN|nr:unnamed protein product [Spirodela intermedia]CAA6660070.1 unnamed protein product [Spirodela intermedia]
MYVCMYVCMYPCIRLPNCSLHFFSSNLFAVAIIHQ